MRHEARQVPSWLIFDVGQDMKNSCSQLVRVERERPFSGHHMLLETARLGLENAEKEELGWLYHELIAITFSALALEAVANSFGHRLIARWEEHDWDGPVAKLRMIAEHLGISDAELSREPWSSAAWLFRLRSKIVHARPELVRFDQVMPVQKFEKIRREPPKSKLELKISRKNAVRAVDAAEKILDLFLARTPTDKLDGLIGDIFSGKVSKP